MSLLDQFTVQCVTLNKQRQDDPYGGYSVIWTEGAHFNAAWEYDSAPEVKVAEQQGIKRTYSIYVDKNFDLDFHEAFRRLDTQEVYRVTNPGTDRMTPATSRLNKRLIEVEKWELPREE